MIEAYLRTLSATLGGVKPPVKLEPLRALYCKHDYTGLVGVVQQTLRLSLHVRVGYVNSGGRSDALAWVSIPTDLPIYGSSSFAREHITLYLRRSFLQEAPFESITAAVAHEFCHVVLHAVRHQLSGAEEAVDLTAMLLGYREVFRVGCRLKEEVVVRNGTLALERHTAGYLTPEEVDYAVAYMQRL